METINRNAGEQAQHEHEKAMAEQYRAEQEKANRRHKAVVETLEKLHNDRGHQRHEYYYESPRGFGNEYTVYSVPAGMNIKELELLGLGNAEKISARRAGQLSSPDNLGNFAGMRCCPCHQGEMARRNQAKFRWDDIFHRDSIWPEPADDMRVSAELGA